MDIVNIIGHPIADSERAEFVDAVNTLDGLVSAMCSTACLFACLLMVTHS